MCIGSLNCEEFWLLVSLFSEGFNACCLSQAAAVTRTDRENILVVRGVVA